MSNLRNKKLNDDIDEVLMALVYIDDLRKMQNFTTDLFTDKEIETIAIRWKAVRMLRAGITYSKIEKNTGMSSATISRLSTLLRNRAGGFNEILKIMEF